MMLRIQILYIIIIFPLFNLSAQKHTAGVASEKAIEDIEWLERFIADVHIDPFSLISEFQWKKSVDSLKTVIRSSGNIEKYALYVQILPVFHNIRDIHMSLYLPVDENDYLISKQYFLNLNIKIIDDQLFSVHSGIPEIPVGTRILSINNISDSLIIDKLRSISPSDGVNKWSKNRIAEKNFIEMFPMLFHVGEKNQLKILLRNEKEPGIIEIKGVNLSKKSFKKRSNSKTTNYHELIYIDSLQTAIIVFPSFSEGNSNEYNDFLHFVFTQIQELNVQHLIIDLRNNEGGYAERGEMLLSYLIPEETPYVANIIFKKSRMADEIFNKQSKNNPLLKRFFVLNELLKMDGEPYGTFDTVYYRNTVPSHYIYLNKLYVLINGMSVSTTGLLCNSLREHRGAVFIGEPGGFTPQGTFGQVLGFTLPNSGITGYMSTIRFNSSNNFTVDTIPFMPDVLVFETIDDIICKKDPVLEQTLKIISVKNNSD